MLRWQTLWKVHDLRQPLERHQVANHFNDVRDCFNEISERRISVTHIVALSELESISNDDGVGARDKWRGEDIFASKDPVSLLLLCMRLVSGCMSLDMMIVRRESRSLQFPRSSPLQSLFTLLILKWFTPLVQFSDEHYNIGYKKKMFCTKISNKTLHW